MSLPLPLTTAAAPASAPAEPMPDEVYPLEPSVVATISTRDLAYLAVQYVRAFANRIAEESPHTPSQLPACAVTQISPKPSNPALVRVQKDTPSAWRFWATLADEGSCHLELLQDSLEPEVTRLFNMDWYSVLFTICGEPFCAYVPVEWIDKEDK